MAAVALGLGALAMAFSPTSSTLAAQGTPPGGASRVTSQVGGTSADSNRDMIAVTGVDITGVSVLYLVDTKTKHLAVYQASGGAGGTQGVKLVGARDISLDLQLDGFNDKTEYRGHPLKHKDLEKRFSGQGLSVDEDASGD
ncbi:MAG: hypothetical protein H6830_09815 [Planctomycetes bacterium]|nr:hypothetical protein [Planctomycetota bacterium]